MKLYDKKVIDGWHCQINEICTDHTGLIAVTRVRFDTPAGRSILTFMIPAGWWERMQEDE